MSFTQITLTVADAIATVTINRPKSLNSVNSETITEVGAAFDLIAADDSVRGVILTGAGDKAFVAGADISELATKDPVSARAFANLGQSVLNKIENLPKPVFAAINGFALGGGSEIAMACHIRIAAAHTKIGQPEVGLGVIPGWGGTQRMPRIVGRGRALELLLGGGVIDANEAYRIGLVNKVIEAYKKDTEGVVVMDEKLRPVFDREIFINEVTKILKSFISKGPVAVAYTLEAVNRGMEHDVAEGLRIEADLFGLVYASSDAKEGLNAFLEKRDAKFEGK